jgi:pimeloyl-ACP methyl ester carboxylesterase
MTSTATMQTRIRTLDGVRIRFAESAGPSERTLLLTSPWPESVYAFASLWSTPNEHARLFAVDLPGFGASERRGELLSPRAMGGFLNRLVDEAGLDVDLGPAVAGSVHERRGLRALVGGPPPALDLRAGAER